MKFLKKIVIVMWLLVQNYAGATEFGGDGSRSDDFKKHVAQNKQEQVSDHKFFKNLSGYFSDQQENVKKGHAIFMEEVKSRGAVARQMYVESKNAAYSGVQSATQKGKELYSQGENFVKLQGQNAVDCGSNTLTNIQKSVEEVTGVISAIVGQVSESKEKAFSGTVVDQQSSAAQDLRNSQTIQSEKPPVAIENSPVPIETHFLPIEPIGSDNVVPDSMNNSVLLGSQTEITKQEGDVLIEEETINVPDGIDIGGLAQSVSKTDDVFERETKKHESLVDNESDIGLSGPESKKMPSVNHQKITFSKGLLEQSCVDDPFFGIECRDNEGVDMDPKGFVPLRKFTFQSMLNSGLSGKPLVQQTSSQDGQVDSEGTLPPDNTVNVSVSSVPLPSSGQSHGDGGGMEGQSNNESVSLSSVIISLPEQLQGCDSVGSDSLIDNLIKKPDTFKAFFTLVKELRYQELWKDYPVYIILAGGATLIAVTSSLLWFKSKFFSKNSPKKRLVRRFSKKSFSKRSKNDRKNVSSVGRTVKGAALRRSDQKFAFSLRQDHW